MITNTEQFQQAIEVLGMMYRALASERRKIFPKSLQWYAIMTEGPIDQIRETQGEMHDYLKLSLPDHPLSGSGSSEEVKITDTVQLRRALQEMSRMYGALGALRADVYPINRPVYELMARPALGFIKTLQTAMDAYLELAAADAESANLARQRSSAPQEVSTK
jgi:hypothetical protein